MINNYKKSGNILNTQKFLKTKNVRQLDEETLNELREAFNLFDTQHSGEIDSRELKAIMRAFGLDVKKDQITLIYKELNKDINEGINFQEFTNIMAPKLGSKDTKEEIERIFQLFDEERQGKISFQNLKKIASEIGEEISDEELYEMIEEADRDGDGCLNFNEFYRIMKKREDPLDDYDSDLE
ncbi:hypothetical protein ABPG72_010301 [Tetrahymena utriculariae]